VSRKHGGTRRSEEYRLRRERNNVAVKKSREKTRERALETSLKVTELKQENVELEMKVAQLSRELGLLKELLLAHARGRSSVEQEQQRDGRRGKASRATLNAVHLDHIYSGKC